jgi:hypothetical protein
MSLVIQVTNNNKQTNKRNKNKKREKAAHFNLPASKALALLPGDEPQTARLKSQKQTTSPRDVQQAPCIVLFGANFGMRKTSILGP